MYCGCLTEANSVQWSLEAKLYQYLFKNFKIVSLTVMKWIHNFKEILKEKMQMSNQTEYKTKYKVKVHDTLM